MNELDGEDEGSEIVQRGRRGYGYRLVFQKKKKGQQIASHTKCYYTSMLFNNDASDN